MDTKSIASVRNIPIIKPFFTEEEEHEVLKVLRSGWITQGPKVAEFERMFCDYIGSHYAIAVSSCTTALHLALLVAGIKEKDEVILPSLTFIATANAVMYCGATPVFVDIEEKSLNIDPSAIEKAITKKTKAIIIVHQVGIPADNDAIYSIARRHNLKVIEDAACAIGSKYKGAFIGRDSELSCFSFHPRKILTTGEGGMITTNNEEFDHALRLLRHQGMSMSDLDRNASKELIFEGYNVVGYNYRLTDLQAAIGIVQLKKMGIILNRRKELANNYNKAFKKLQYLIPLSQPDYGEANYQSYCAYVNLKTNKTRNDLMKYLLDRGIASRRGIMSIHREKPYREIAKPYNLKRSENASDNTIILPLYHQMTQQDQTFVIKNINDFFET